MATLSQRREEATRRCAGWQEEGKMSKIGSIILQVFIAIFLTGFFFRLIYFVNKRYTDDIIVTGILIIVLGIYLYLIKLASKKFKKEE